MTDYYALFGSFEPHLWGIILDVFLLDTKSYNQFKAAFYPILETFPLICSCNDYAPVKQWWLNHLLRVEAVNSGIPTHVYAFSAAVGMGAHDMANDETMDVIAETEADAACYNTAMDLRNELRNTELASPRHGLVHCDGDQIVITTQGRSSERINRANHFRLPELNPHHHPPQGQKRPRIPSAQTTPDKHTKY